MVPEKAGQGLALTLLLLAACRSYEPHPLHPSEQRRSLAERGRETEDTLEATSLADLPEEWFPLAAHVDLEDGLTLAEANTLALVYAPGILAARSRARLRGIQLLQSGLLPNPELFVGPRLYEGGGGLNVPATLSFEIPYAGRWSATRGHAEAELEAARFRVMSAELRVLADVRRGFLQLAALRTEHSLLEELEAGAARAEGWVERLQAAGEVDALGLYLARLEREEARQRLCDKDGEITQTEAELLATLGLLADVSVSLAADRETFMLPELPERDQDRMLRHPRLEVAEAEYRSAEQQLRLEIARQYPDLHVGPDFESDDGLLSLGIGIRLPLQIFDQNQHAISAAEELRQAAREAFDAELLTLTSSVQVARSRLEAAEALLVTHGARIAEVADAADRALTARFERGQATVLEVLAARTAIARARLREVGLQRTVAEAKLEAAVAGGLVFGTKSSAADQEQGESE